MTRLCITCLLLVAGVAADVALAAALPPALPAEVTYFDKKTKQEVKLSGEMVFEAWPVMRNGRATTIAKSDLVPTQVSDGSFTRIDEKTFTVKTFRGTYDVQFAFPKIPVKMADAAEIRNALDGGFVGPAMEDLVDKHGEAEKPTVVFGSNARSEYDLLEVALIKKIQFGVPAGFKTEVNGRYISYNQKFRGSDGAVVVEAATFFGGAGDEVFQGGAFLKDGSVIAVTNLQDLSFLGGVKQNVIGADLPMLAAPPRPATLPVGRKATPPDPRNTVAIAHYSPDLKKLIDITRFTSGAATAYEFKTSPSGAMWLSGLALDRFGELMKVAAKASTIESDTGSKAAPSTFLAKLSADARRIEVLVLFKGRGFSFGCRPNDEALVESNRTLWVVTAAGEVKEIGQSSATRRGRFNVSPYDGCFYIGGDYGSGTGFEPYRNPYLHKFDAGGKIQWTAWDWTGPMVGVHFRQVSDSSARGVKFARNGDILVIGWSDGGNTVLTNLPYDLEGWHGKYRCLHDMSAAGVGSFCHLLRMNSRTMDVRAGTMWIAYQPLTNRPNSGAFSDLAELEDGRWVGAGSTAWGLIETRDAWVEPWIVQYEKDPKTARPHGGPCFVMFDSEFAALRFSSLTPGLRQQHLATRGTKVLITGAAPEMEVSYGVEMRPILASPVQKTYGGGTTDGYLMLVDVGRMD